MPISTLALLCLSVVTAAPEGAALERFEYRQTEMAVPMRIVLYAPEAGAAEAAAKAAFARIHALNAILSDYDDQSELRRLAPGKPVQVSDDLWNVLARSQEVSAMTEGAFDVTVSPVIRLWRRARKLHELPSDKRIREALALVGHERMRLDPERRTVELTTPGMLLDVGGIAKGYATQEARKVLCEKDIPRSMVEAGGDIALGDPPPGKKGWRIGIAPPNPNSPPRYYLTLANTAISTSGDMWQYVTIDGKRYSHVVDPRTGMALSDHCYVALVMTDGTMADALSTAISVLGPEKGLKLVESLPGAAALIIRQPDGKMEVHESKRWAALEPEEAAHLPSSVPGEQK